MTDRKIYLGDGAYVEFSGSDFRLTTENGISVQNEIYLEPRAIEQLYAFYKSKFAAVDEGRET